MGALSYRLALDLGSTSLGWAMVRLKDAEPVAIIKAGVRIFSDGRNPKDGSSLAVTRRAARAMRRRRDRLLKRKHRMMALLLKHGFFPADTIERKALELLNPYELRAKGLDTKRSRPPNSPVPCFTSTSDEASRATARQTRRTTTVARSKRLSALCANNSTPTAPMARRAQWANCCGDASNRM
jgi:hypothetical protein